MKLLIVDDSNVIRRAIARAIGEPDYEIRTAGNGAEAIDVLDEFRPEVVTMDITMPEMDGLMIISALADASTAVEAVKRGAQGFLLKPFTAETLNTELVELFRD